MPHFLILSPETGLYNQKSIFSILFQFSNSPIVVIVETEIRDLIQRELPHLIAEDPGIRDFILRTVSEYYNPRDEFSDRFDRILVELQRDREEQRLKWEEQRIERDRDRKESNQRHEGTLDAAGTRWGLYSEVSFRNGLQAILAESFGVEVLKLQEQDPEGEVFWGHPDQVEIGLILTDGLVIACEIKSSISKAEMYIFDCKVAFYQKRYQRSVNRKIVISPMVDARALPVAEQLGIEVYSYADEVQA